MKLLPPTSAAGFGLVEFMVALAIIAILASLGAASFGSVTGKTRVTAAASGLLHAIELTRAESLKRASRVTLAPNDGTWTSGWAVFIDVNGNRRLDAGEPLLHQHAALPATTRLVADTTPGYIAFGMRGTPQQYGGAFLAGTITLCDGNVAQSVVLAKSGRPRVGSAAC